MNKKEMTSGNGVKLEGYVDIELFNSKDNTRRRVHNTITKAGKQLFLHKSVGQLMQSGASLFGKVACLNSMICTFGTFSGSYIGDTSNTNYINLRGHISSSDLDVTCGLLNLGTKQNALTEVSSFIPSYDDTGALDGLVGFANNNVNTSLTNEGLVDMCKAEYCADPYTVCNRWKFDVNIASGKIDTLVMAPASVFKSKNSNGFRFMKCIEGVNIQDEGFKSLSTGFLPPNITGYTSSNEVLLNFDNGTGSRWKYNLDTGEITAVPDEDKFYIIVGYKSTNPIQDYYVEGDHMYLLYGDTHITVYVVDLTTGTEITSFNTRYANFTACRFISVNDKLYINGIMNDSVEHKVYELNKSGAYYNSINTTTKTFADLGITVPSSFADADVCFAHYGSKYVMEYRYDTSTSLISGNTSQKIGGLRGGFVFNSLSNISGTLSDKISMITIGSLYCNKGIIQNGQCSTSNKLNDTVYQQSDQLAVDTSGGGWAVANNRNNNTTSTKTKALVLDNMGVWISLDGWWSDIVSFVKLNTPIEKGDSDIMYVSYGYKVVV